MNNKELPFSKRQILVSEYRLLKFVEHAARKFAPNVKLKELRDEELKKEYIDLVLDMYKGNSLKDEEYLSSKEVAKQRELFKLLKDKGLLAEVVVEIEIALGKSTIKGEEKERYIEFLQYCMNNPKELREYKIS